MNKDKALKLALEALELAQDNLRNHGDNCFLHDEGEYNRCFCGKDSLSDHLQSVVEKLDEALAQPEQEPKRCSLCNYQHGHAIGCANNPVDIAIQALAQPEQEPVAWCESDGAGGIDWRSEDCFSDDPVWLDNPVPLYTTPPRRTWVGLTDTEMREVMNLVSYSPLAMTMAEWVHAVQKATEEKLKEKNI